MVLLLKQFEHSFCIFKNSNAFLSFIFTDGNTVRDRKTGRRAKFHRDTEKDREQQKRDAERKQVYDRWGAGLKQIEDFEHRIATETHEMAKPVARYANDNDLEDYLRNQCRDGDPMAQYMQKKTTEKQSGPRKLMRVFFSLLYYAFLLLIEI